MNVVTEPFVTTNSPWVIPVTDLVDVNWNTIGDWFVPALFGETDQTGTVRSLVTLAEDALLPLPAASCAAEVPTATVASAEAGRQPDRVRRLTGTGPRGDDPWR